MEQIRGLENRLVAARWEGGRGGMEQALGVGRCKPSYIERINEVQLNSTGNRIQYPVINHNGKEYGKECIYVYN